MRAIAAAVAMGTSKNPMARSAAFRAPRSAYAPHSAKPAHVSGSGLVSSLPPAPKLACEARGGIGGFSKRPVRGPKRIPADAQSARQQRASDLGRHRRGPELASREQQLDMIRHIISHLGLAAAATTRHGKASCPVQPGGGHGPDRTRAAQDRRRTAAARETRLSLTG